MKKVSARLPHPRVPVKTAFGLVEKRFQGLLVWANSSATWFHELVLTTLSYQHIVLYFLQNTIYGKQSLSIVSWGPIFGSKCPSLSTTPCVDLTDVTLADEDTKSILTDNDSRAIQGNDVATQVTLPGGQLCKQ